jgi:hypothetical protein
MTMKKFYQKIDMLIEGDKGKLIINNEITELKETQRQTLEDRNKIRKNTTNGGKNIRFVSAMWKWKKGKQSYGYKSGVRLFFSSPWKIFNLPNEEWEKLKKYMKFRTTTEKTSGEYKGLR